MDEAYDDDPGSSGGNGPSLFLVLIGIVAAVSAVFVVQNSDRATIRFLFVEGEVRIWVALALALVLGALLDRLVQIWRRRSRRKKAD